MTTVEPKAVLDHTYSYTRTCIMKYTAPQLDYIVDYTLRAMAKLGKQRLRR